MIDNVVNMPRIPPRIETITLTPDMAVQLLGRNKLNYRRVSDQHVQRIAREIKAGKWMFNGNTIKIAAGGDLIDGQHRLLAVIEAKQAVETLIAYGIEREAFETIDTDMITASERARGRVRARPSVYFNS